MADIIDLAEGVAAEIGDGAEVMFAPEFDLKGIKEKRIVVVPAGIETKPNARDYLEEMHGGRRSRARARDRLHRAAVPAQVGCGCAVRQGGVQSALFAGTPARKASIHRRGRTDLPLGASQ